MPETLKRNQIKFMQLQVCKLIQYQLVAFGTKHSRMELVKIVDNNL